MMYNNKIIFGGTFSNFMDIFILIKFWKDLDKKNKPVVNITPNKI